MKKSNDLHAFLRKHGAVKKFKEALKGRTSAYANLEQAVEDGLTDRGVIAGAFWWDQPNSGADESFWSDLNAKYIAQFKAE